MQTEPQSPEGTANLLEGFAALREAASPKVWNAGLQKDQLLPRPFALEIVARQLAIETKKQPLPRRPPFDSEEARRQWQRYLTTRDSSQIERRAVRSLCWDPEVAPTTEFLHLIEKSDRSPSAPMILGLLGVYHLRWENRNDGLELCVTKWLRAYQGYNPILHRLREIADEVVGPKAPEQTARSAFEKRCPVRNLLEERGLALNTPYAFSAASRLLNANLLMLERTRDLNQARYICEQLVPSDRDLLLLRPEAYAATVKRLILLSSRNEDSHLRDVVKDFVLREERLGDPRRHPGRWDNMGLSAEAETIKGWLSEEDLKFFFDLIMEGQEDRHHRRDFWLRYVHRVTNSSVVIGGADRDRLRRQLNELRTRGRTYANLNARDVSAFIMDFGNALVVEFSRTGHACFIYEANTGQRKIVNLQANEFSVSRLKALQAVSERIVHDRSGNWMQKVRQHLALRYRIRE